MSEQAKPAARLRLKLKVADGTIGPGKIALLEAVAREGSISAAARSMGMSYRRAWHLLDSLNSLVPSPVIEASAGGKAGGGATLTPYGQRLIALYREAEVKAEAAAAELLDSLKP